MKRLLVLIAVAVVLLASQGPPCGQTLDGIISMQHLAEEINKRP